MRKIRSLVSGLLLVAVASTSMACSYGGVAMASGKAVIARNDHFILGLLRQVYVCDVTDDGLANCESKQNP